MSTTKRNYWIDLFSLQSWHEFLAAGASVSGFNEKAKAKMAKMQVGDYLLCYVTGVSRFIGILEVCSAPFHDTSPLWSNAVFPERISVKCIASLLPETAIPILDLKSQLSFFKADPHLSAAWTGYVRSSPTLLKPIDGEAITTAILGALENPIIKPLKKKVQYTASESLSTTVIEPTQQQLAPYGNIVIDSIVATSVEESVTKEESEHTAIQYLLLHLGVSMGLSVYVASNDVNRKYKGKKLSEHFDLHKSLPQPFDAFTNNNISYIDVVWFKGGAYYAAFEIESTTSIYSGLLRMSDLLAMQPNINIPLFIVAPEERREKVKEEINRPTFARFPTPMVKICRFISFSELRKKFGQAEEAGLLDVIKFEFLNKIAEDCSVPENK